MTNRSDPPEAVGAYRDKQASDNNWLPWVIGAIVLLLLIALIWWAMAGDDTTETTPDATTPDAVYDDPAAPTDPAADPAADPAVGTPGTPPAE